MRADLVRDQLVAKHAPLARKIARVIAVRYKTFGVSYEDCRQSGMLGLLEAASRFSDERNASFETFASYRIKGSILNALKDYSEQLDYYHHQRSLERERNDSIFQAAQVAEESHFDTAVALTLDVAIGAFLAKGPNPGTTEVVTPYRSADDYVLNAKLFEIALDLPQPEREVIYYHYFLDSKFIEIAELLGLSRSRVSQVHAAALAKVRDRCFQRSELYSQVF